MAASLTASSFTAASLRSAAKVTSSSSRSSAGVKMMTPARGTASTTRAASFGAGASSGMRSNVGVGAAPSPYLRASRSCKPGHGASRIGGVVRAAGEEGGFVQAYTKASDLFANLVRRCRLNISG